MADKYWWEKDDKKTTTQSATNSNNQTEKKYWWEKNTTKSDGTSDDKSYWWENGGAAKAVSNTIAHRVNEWLKNHNSYISDYQNRTSGRKYNLDDSYVSDSAEWLESATKRKNDSYAEAQSIMSYIEENKNYLDSGWAKDVRALLARAKINQSNILDFYKKDNEYWQGFKDETEYGYAQRYSGKTSTELKNLAAARGDDAEKEWLTSYADSVAYNEKLNFDTVAGEQEVADLEAVYAEMKGFIENELRPIAGSPERYDEDVVNAAYERYEQFQNQYGDIRQLENLIREKKDYLEDAQHTQKYVTMSGVSDQHSKYYDPDFEKYAEIGATADYVAYTKEHHQNNSETNKGYNAAIVALAEHYDQPVVVYYNDKASVDRYKKYMRDEEFQTLAYYVAKDQEQGTNLAEQYIDSLEELLTQRETNKVYSIINLISTYLPVVKYLYGAYSGLDQFVSGIDSLVPNRENHASSVTQAVSAMIREDQNLFGKVIYDLVTTTSNMVPSILASTAIGMVNPAAGAAVGSGLMGLSSAGHAYQEAINLGYDNGQARLYSALVGASEAGLQYLMGGIGKLGSKITGKAAVNLASKFDSALSRVAVQYGSNMLAEGTEEYLQEILTPLFKNIALKTDEEINLITEDAIYSFVLGALSSGVMEGGNLVSGIADVSSNKQANIDAKNLYGGSTAELIAEGLASPVESESYQNAQIAKRKMDKGKVVSGYEIRQMVNSNSKQIASEITPEAKSRLKELGETKDINNIASLVAKKVSGQQLTRAEIGTLARSQFGAQVAKEMSGIETDASTDTKQEKVAYKPLEERVGTEAKFNVSNSGQATVRGTGTAIDNLEFVTVGDGQATMKVDGKEVSADDIDFASEEQSYMVSAVSSIENITPAAANGIVTDIIDTSKPLNQQLNGIDEAYNYGYHGYSEADLKAGDFTSNLTNQQMMDAYGLGKSARKISAETKDAPRIKMRTEAEAKLTKKEKAAKQNARFDSENVEVYFEDGETVTKFDESNEYDDTRMAAVNYAKLLYKMGIGGKYYFYRSYVNSDGVRVYKDANGNEVKAPNGMYRTSDGSIHIDLNAGDKGQGTTLFTLGHELTHFIKQWSETKFKVLADFLNEEYGKTDVSLRERVLEKQIELSESRNEKVSYDEAFEEVVADAMSTMLTDGNLAEKLAKLKKTDKGLFNKIKQFFDRMIAKFQALYKNLTPEQQAARDVRNMKDAFDKIQTAFAEALVEASENFHAAMESVVESDAEAISTDEIITDGAVVTDGNGEKYSIRSMKHDISDGKMFRDLMNVCGWTQEQVTTLRNQLNDLVEYMIPYRNILDMNESYGMEGRRFSPYKPNSDPLYKISMDFSTLCSKRLLTQYVIEQLQLRENRPMSAEEQMAIRDMLNEYRKVEKGLQVACSMCYVEAARLKSPKQMQRWLDDPTPHLINYFALKNTEFNNSVKKAQADFKESKGYDRNAPKKDMKQADVRELNKIGPKMRSQYKPSAEEQAIIEKAKTLPNSTYLTAGNLASLSETDPAIYDAYTAFIRTATRSKSLETDEPYYYGDSTRDNGNGIIVSDSFIEAVNRENGMRFSSWSDWRIQHLLDYITAVIDNSVRGAAMHGYTKFGDEVRVLGKTGMMFNMSGVAGTQTGLNEDGSLNFSDTESINVEEAIQLREEFPEHAGLQCIGVSNEHIIALLRSDIIDYVIPYHVSGLNADLRRMAKIYGWKDYTSTQHATEDKSVKQENAVDKEHWHEEPVWSEFFVGYDTGMSGIEAMKASAEKYKQMCKDRGLKPKFEQFATEDNYWKLLIDRKMINQQTGNLIRQKAVTPTFDFDVIKSVVDKFVDNYDAGLEARALNHIVENWESIPQRIKDLKKKGSTKAKKAADTLANQTVAAQPSDSVKRSDGIVEQMKQHMDSIMAIESVASINKENAVPFLGSRNENYNAGGKVFKAQGSIAVREGYGTVQLTVNGAKESVFHGNGPAKQATFPAIKAVIEQGIEVGRDYNHNGKGFDTVTFAAPIDFFGHREALGVVVKEFNNAVGEKNFYIHEICDENGNFIQLDNGIVTVKEKVASATPNPKSAADATYEGNSPAHTVTQLKPKVNKNSDRTGTKAVNSVEGVKFSDRDYMAAVNRGDTETAQRLVDEAAEKWSEGHEVYTTDPETGEVLLKFYRSADGGRTVWNGHGNNQNQGVFLTSNPYIADAFDASLGIPKGQKSGQHITVYAKAENPFVIDAKGRGYTSIPIEENSVPNWLYEASSSDVEWSDKANDYVIVDYIDIDNLFPEAFKQGHDAVIVTNVVEGVGGGLATDVVLKDGGKQMKSADPVTYDDDGNVIPLSKRFNPENKDIRYSERTGYSTSNRTLLANAFEGLSQNSEEYKLIQRYKGRIQILNELEEKLSNLNAEIRQIRFGKDGVKDTAKLRQLEAEAKNTAKLINAQDKKLLSLEASEPLRKVIEQERKKEAQKTRDHVKEIQQNRKVKAEQTEIRHKIRKAIRDLDKILKHGNKQKNVKEELQPVVTKALQAAEILFTDNYNTYDMLRNGLGVDLSDSEEALVKTCTQMLKDLDKMPTDGYENWQARQEAENKLKTKMSKLNDVFARERKRLNNTTVSSILGELADAYASLENSEQSYVQGAYTEAVHNFLKNLQQEVGGTIVKDMTKDQLESVYAAYKMVLNTVRNANKMFNNELKQSREQLGNAVIEEVIKAGGVHLLGTKVGNTLSQASWNNMKPIWVGNRIGSDTFGKLMDGLFKGQYDFAVDIAEAKKFKLSMDEKYHPRNWDAKKSYEFESSTGKKFSLNLQQIMSLYAFSKREQAYSHLLNGGFVFEKNSTVIVEEDGKKKTYIHKGATSYKLNEATLNDIINSLTEEQKAYVDEMQAYLSGVMGAKGNEVSMALYGIKMFNEQFYFPLRSSGAYMEKAKEAEMKKQQGQINLVNSGFTHSVKPKAKNPIILAGFMDVWAEHCNEMSMYHSMVLPMEDFRKVYNYTTIHDENMESASVFQTIQDAYGEAATNYIDQLYKELNAGATIDPRETLFKQFISNFKKSAVMLSGSVVVQQFSSIGRAYAVIDPRYFVGSKVNSDTGLSAVEEMKKYAPVAIIKEMGGFDTGTKGNATSYIKAEKYGKRERIKGFLTDKQYRGDVMGFLPAWADEKTWCAIWEAAKRETKAKNPDMDVKSDAFLKLAGERFSEIIEKTQVYDSVLARSANMRSKGAFMNMATAFMAEPTTTVNLIESAIRTGKAKNISRAFGAVAVTIVLNNALASIVYAMRDDDEDETFLEKYFQSFTSGMIDDINPMTYYPFLKDVWSLFQGYDVERSDMSVIADVRDALKQAYTLLAKDTSNMTDDELAEHNKKLWGALGSVLDAGCSAFGVPIKNVRRDAMGIVNAWNTVSTDVSGERNNSWNSFWDKVGSAAKDAVPFLAWTKDKSKADKLYDAIVSGDKAYLDRLKSGYKDEDAYTSAVRKALRENDSRIHDAAQARYDGNTAEYKRIFNEIKNEGKFSFDDIMSAINSEESKIKGELEPDKETSEYSAADFVDAILVGDTSTAKAVRNSIISFKMSTGMSREDAEKSFESSVSSSARNAFDAGLLNEAGAKKMLMEYADMDEEDATSRADYWAFAKANPKYRNDLSEARVEKFREFAEPANISLDVFVQFVKGTAGLETIKDEWGDVEKSVRDQTLEVIDSLPLTWQQKDALYLAAELAESKIWDVPW